MCDLAVEAISNDELGFSDSDIDDMYDDCTAVHSGCLDECNGEDGYDALSSRKPESFSSRSSKSKQRNHHYTFDINDNDLDKNGFIIYSDKGQGKRRKFRVYLDSNENGSFDKNDQLIGRTGLKHKHAAKGVGNLLDEDELGQLEVKFKRYKSNASMRSYKNAGNEPVSSINSMTFSNPDEESVARFDVPFIPRNLYDIGLEAM